MHPARFVCVVLSVSAALLAVGAADARSGSTAQTRVATASSAAGAVSVNYKISRFAQRGHKLVAYGTAIARYVPGSVGSEATAVRKQFQAGVTIHSASTRGLASAQTLCPILTLDLQQLDLNLLGLLVHADRVFLTLTGDSTGGLLGNILCGLASSGKLTTQASKLNWATKQSGLAINGTGYTFAVQPPAASSSSEGGSPTSDSTTSLTTFALCPILELTLGPLDANLLGLLVHLDQVHLTLVANSDGGILGSLFCSVFNGG